MGEVTEMILSIWMENEFKLPVEVTVRMLMQILPKERKIKDLSIWLQLVFVHEHNWGCKDVTSAYTSAAWGIITKIEKSSWKDVVNDTI